MATPIPVNMGMLQMLVQGIQTTQTSEWKSFWDEQNKTIRKRSAMDFSYFGILSREVEFHFEKLMSLCEIGIFSIFPIKIRVVKKKKGDYRLSGWDI